MFGTGYAGAEDRLFLMDVLRHTAEGQLAAFVGGSQSNRAMDETQWGIAPYTQADLQSQIDLAAEAVRRVRARSSCRTARTTSTGSTPTSRRPRTRSTSPPSCPPSTPAILSALPQPWKLTDVIAEASLIGGIFGLGGGGQVDSAIALEKLAAAARQARRRARLERLPRDRRPRVAEHDHQQAVPVRAQATRSRPRAWRCPTRVGDVPGDRLAVGVERRGRRPELRRGPLANVGANLRAALLNPTHASNWELISARHSADGHALAVMGPQVGYYVPEILDGGGSPRPRDRRPRSFVPGRQPVRGARPRPRLRVERDHVHLRQRLDLRRGALPGRLPLSLQGPVPGRWTSSVDTDSWHPERARSDAPRHRDADRVPDRARDRVRARHRARQAASRSSTPARPTSTRPTLRSASRSSTIPAT